MPNMIKRLTKIGNSQALVFDRTMLELLGLKEGDSVRLSIEGRKLIVEAEKRAPRLEQVGSLLKGISDRHDTAFSNLAK